MPEILPYLIWALIKAATDKHHIDPLLFIAIGLHEKGRYGWTDAVLGDFAVGGSVSPMQLYLSGAGTPPPGWDKQAWANELTKPEVWTEVAAAHIAYLLEWSGGDVEKTVAAYNRGPYGTFDNSQTYVAPVMENYRRLQRDGITVVGSGDHDRQTFIPETGKWMGEFVEWAPLTGGNQESLANLRGIATDAVEAGRLQKQGDLDIASEVAGGIRILRQTADKLELEEAALRANAERWGNR